MRRVAALAVALTLGTCLIAVPTVARAADFSCTSGTVVAVDFGHWGGPIARGCVSGAKTGAELLDKAGFSRTGTQHDGPAFICRLGNEAFDDGTQYPTPADEPCVATPPASAYWSYWLAPKGQHSWSYSQYGAYADHPQEGGVELWHFGGTNIAGNCGSGVPPYSPDAIRGSQAPSGGDGGVACKSKQDQDEALGRNGAGGSGGHSSSGTHGGSGGSGGSHTTRHHSNGHHSVGSGGSGADAASTGAKSHGTSTTAPVSAHASTSMSGATGPASAAGASASSPASAQPTTAVSGGPTIVDAKPASADTKKPSTGSVLPVLLGVALAVLLAAGTGATMLRRRRAQG